MHAFIKVILWLAVILLLTISEKYIPRQEAAFRMAVALTWLLWLIVGGLYGLRGLWRFLRA